MNSICPMNFFRTTDTTDTTDTTIWKPGFKAKHTTQHAQKTNTYHKDEKAKGNFIYIAFLKNIVKQRVDLGSIFWRPAFT